MKKDRTRTAPPADPPAPGTEIVAAHGRPSGDAGCVVIKLGGRSLDPPDALLELAAALAGVAHGVILVHGGGPEVSAWCTRLGLAPRFEDGLRVTDAEILEVATAVLAGLANKRLVAALRAQGVDALGLTALDGGIVRVVPHGARERLGHVGEVESVDAARLGAWLDAGLVPVIASIGAYEGALLNLNADDVAAAIAGAIGARTLVLLSDTPGVRVAGAFARTLDLAAVDAALAGTDVQGGMRPKLRAARAAMTAGAGTAWIASWQGPDTLRSLLVDGMTSNAADAPSAPGADVPANANASMEGATRV